MLVTKASTCSSVADDSCEGGAGGVRPEQIALHQLGIHRFEGARMPTMIMRQPSATALWAVAGPMPTSIDPALTCRWFRRSGLHVVAGCARHVRADSVSACSRPGDSTDGRGV